MPDRKPFLDLVAERVVVLDGALGSALQERTDLELDRDWMGQENLSEVLNFSRPDVLLDIHKGFLEAGLRRGGEQQLRRQPHRHGRGGHGGAGI